MRELSEKYLALRDEFPNKAGKLRQVIETQKRLLEIVMKQPHTPEVQQLIVSSAEGYVVATELLDYMHKLLTGVAEDATVLREGSELRMINKMQALDIQRSWEKLEDMAKLIIENNKLKRELAAYEPA